jgi:large subunit ribosomal protein L18
MRSDKKKELLQRRRWRIRKKLYGTLERPRLSVRFTGKNIHVQFIDDEAGVTLASASTLNKLTPDREKLGANVKSAMIVGKLAAEAAKSKGIAKVVFDRSAAKYHGKVKALADVVREAGLNF